MKRTILLFLSIPILSFANMHTIEKEVSQLIKESNILKKDAENNDADDVYWNARIEAFFEVLEIIEKERE